MANPEGLLINSAVSFVTMHVVGQEGTTAVASVGLALALYTCLGALGDRWLKKLWKQIPPGILRV